MVLSYSSGLDPTCYLPASTSTALSKRVGGFVCVYIHESDEAGDKKGDLNTSHVPIHLSEDKAEEEFCLTG